MSRHPTALTLALAVLTAAAPVFAQEQGGFAEQPYDDEAAAQDQGYGEQQGYPQDQGYEQQQSYPQQSYPQQSYQPADFLFRQQQPIFSLSMDGGGNQDLADVGVGMRFEGNHFGLLFRASAMRPGFGLEAATLWSVEPTFAIVAAERFRWRLLGGLAGASYAGVSMVSFSAGTEAIFCLGGPLDLELGVTYTPFPYTRMEATADLALLMGAFSIRGGLRAAYFHDHGFGMSGIRDFGYLGPHLGLGFHL